MPFTDGIYITAFETILKICLKRDFNSSQKGSTTEKMISQWSKHQHSISNINIRIKYNRLTLQWFTSRYYAILIYFVETNLKQIMVK